MNSSEAAEAIEWMIEKIDLNEPHRAIAREALVRAKQALEILATIEEKLGDRKLLVYATSQWNVDIKIRKDESFTGFGGEDLVDALGQATTVMSLD